MKEIKSNSHVAKIAEDYVRVDRFVPQPIQETRIDANGATMTWVEPSHDSSLGRLAAALNAMPLFAMIPDDNMFFIDTAAGVCRWRGCVTKKQVVDALTKCDFDRTQIKEILKATAALKDPYLPHYR